MSTTYTPPSDFFNSTPHFSVDIYPRNGAKYTFTGDTNGILSATVEKNIRAKTGTFKINIVPGGPKGINDSTSWIHIINPYSLAVIYCSRGQSKKIVMIGLTTSVGESQTWTRRGVQRAISIEGQDFSLFFTAFSYYQMSYLGLLQPAAGLGFGYAGFITGNMINGYQGSNPADMAYFWLSRVMVGVGNTAQAAILEFTDINYKGTNYLLRDLLGYWIEPFTDGPAFIPILSDFFNSDGNWLSKFFDICPFPYYEVFITTGTETDYPAIASISQNTASKNSNQNGSSKIGFAFDPSTNIQVTGFEDSFPMFIARVNPLPYAELNSNGTNFSWVKTRWDNLPIFDYTKYGFINSAVGYDESNLANFFVIIPSDALSSGKSSNGPYLAYPIEQYGVMFDRNSINRFGYVPKPSTVKWFVAINPTPLINAPNGYKDMLAMYGMLSSYYLPSIYMLKGAITLPMWPSIYPGNRFVCVPTKGTANNPDDTFMFYIEGVRHSYTFGGPSTTTLLLDRGLRVNDYGNSDTMTSLSTGNSELVDGKIQGRSNVESVSGLGHFLIPNINAALSPATVPAGSS